LIPVEVIGFSQLRSADVMHATYKQDYDLHKLKCFAKYYKANQGLSKFSDN